MDGEIKGHRKNGRLWKPRRAHRGLELRRLQARADRPYHLMSLPTPLVCVCVCCVCYEYLMKHVHVYVCLCVLLCVSGMCVSMYSVHMLCVCVLYVFCSSSLMKH